MTSQPVEIGPITSADFERWHDIRRQAFGTTETFDPDLYARIPPERVLGAFVGGTLMAATVVHAYRQTWAHTPVPCGGVSGVIVAPEARGRGAARELLRAHLAAMSERGEVLAALYPTTASLYRSMGFEVVGQYSTRSVPHFTVPDADTLDWERVDLDDPRIAAVEASSARTRTGWLERDAETWNRIAARWRGEATTNRFAYVGRRDGVDVAALVYHYVEPDHGEFGVFYAIETDVIAAQDPQSWASTLAFVARQSTTSAELITDLPDATLLPLLTHPQRARVRRSLPWMLRLVDVPGAVAIRGAPLGVAGSVEIDLVDDVLPANSGAWTLDVADGSAALSPGGSRRCRLSVQTLAMLYAGADVHAVASAGLVPGASRQDLDLLAATFAGTPEVQFFF